MKLRALGFLTILVFAAGCNPAKPVVVDPPAPAPAIDTPASTTNIDAAADQPTIEIANWEQAQQLVARNPGKVVILDLWASW